MEAVQQVAVSTDLIPITELAKRTALPVAWLRARTKVGALPGLRVGGRVLYNLQAVRDAVALAATNPVAPRGGNEAPVARTAPHAAAAAG